MGVSVKCQYGLRALFELAKRKDEGLVRLHDVAEAQCIPQRFLENILNQFRQGGFVESRRGKDGGFTLLKPPDKIYISDIIRFIDGPIYPVECAGRPPAHNSSFKGTSVFIPLWEEARKALEAVYESKTLQDLLDSDSKMRMNDYYI